VNFLELEISARHGAIRGPAALCRFGSIFNLNISHPFKLGKQRQSWHTVTQEATLRRLADVTGVSADELYRLNKRRLDGLQLGATLRVGTRLLTAGVDGHEDEEYCSMAELR
jgi:hypothetical protein